MKFRETFLFELRFQLSRPATWIYFVVVLGFSSLATYGLLENVQKGDYYLNSPVIVSLVTAISSMFGLLLTAAICGNAAVRDRQAGMESLFFTTPLGKINYLGGRFLALLSINFSLLLIIMMLLFLTSLVPSLQEYFISNHFASYTAAALYFAVPNTLITSSILFSLSLFTRKAMAAFVAAALLFMVALFTMDIIAGELGKWDLAKKIDHSGLTILKELRAVQTPLELKSAFVAPGKSLLLNRFLWVSGSLILLCGAYFKFSFKLHTGGKRSFRKKETLPSVAPEKIWGNGISAPPVLRTFDLKMRIKQVVYLSLNSFRSMFIGMVWFIYPIIAVISVIASEEVLEGQLGVPMIPTSAVVLDFLKAMGTGLILALLSTYYAGDLVWKERDARLNEINDASPVRDSVLFISKFLGLVILLFFMQILVMCTGFIVEFLLDSPSIDVLLYLKVIFGLRMVDLLLFAVVAFLVHVLVNQKYVGHLIVFIVFFYMYFPGEMKLNHNLLIFGSAPEWTYSEISGFASSIGPWLWFKFYWAAWGIVLALVSKLFWVRGKEQKLSRRFNQAKLRISGTPAKVGLPVFLVVFLVGGYIFYNTNILNNYDTVGENLERRATYEKKYSRYKYAPQPILSAVQLQVELFPKEQEAEIKGFYKLVNKSSVAIDTLHVSTTSDINPEELTFSEEATVIIVDNDLGHRIYRLKQPLLPGETLTMEFLARYDQDGFGNHGRDRDIVANGTYIGYHLLPSMGYEEDREIDDKEEREKYGLSPQSQFPSLYDRSRRMDISGAEKIHFEAVLGTLPGQTAITAGTLKRSWTENNRRYFHYATDVPITHNYEIFSAEYRLHEARWEDVEIQLFYHPEHTRNLERMVHGVQASLEYFSKNFSPYPHSQIRLVEFPGSGVGLNGNPVTMSYTEGFSFFAPEKDHRELDFPFAVIGHEVAHQWWGNELRPAYVEGAPILTESLAWYSSWMLMENTFGKEHLERLLRVMRQEYLTPRSPADLPLLRTTDHFNAYRKGPFALYTVQEYIGEDKVNLALKRLLEKFDTREPPLPVTLDLYAELQQVTPDSLQYLVKDLFEHNTFWELEAKESTTTPAEGDKWNVTFNLNAKKMTVDEEGVVTNLPIKDYIDLAVYGNSPEGELGELLYLKRHWITREQQTFKVQVSKKPDLVGIDPNHLLIDRDPYNNFKQLTIPSKKGKNER